MKLSPRMKDYLTSGRLIHEALTEFVDELAERLRSLSMAGEDLRPMLLFWVNEGVKGDDGNLISGKVVMEFDDMGNVQKHMEQGVSRTNAYAVVLFQPNKEELRLDLETPHGAETWQMEKQKRGDTCFVRPPNRSSSNSIFGVIRSALS
jgi:hypothetical protein